jgi:hypothetical protein
MTLEDHRLKNKRKEKNKLVRLDWATNTGNCSAILTGRSEWVINTASTTHKQTTGETSTDRNFHPTTALLLVSKPLK